MEEIQTEADGVMPELSDYSASLTKEDIKDFETELNVKIPASMKKFYLKFNGGMLLHIVINRKTKYGLGGNKCVLSDKGTHQYF